MVRVGAMVALVLALGAGPALAAWTVQEKENLFSGGTEIVVLGIASRNNSLYLSCSSPNDVSLSFIERTNTSDWISDIYAKLAVKTQSGDRHLFDVISYIHNSDYIGFRIDFSAAPVGLLRDLREAVGKISLGLQIQAIDYEWSGTLSSRGSTRAMTKMGEVCAIDLNAGS